MLGGPVGKRALKKSDFTCPDLTHGDEPGCAVMAAVDAGDLDPGRLDSFHALQSEVAARQALRDPRARKTAGRKMAQMVKEAVEEKRKRGR